MKKKVKKPMYLVIYSHRFGDDYTLCKTLKKAKEVVQHIHEVDFEASRGEAVYIESLAVEE